MHNRLKTRENILLSRGDCGRVDALSYVRISESTTVSSRLAVILCDPTG